MNQIKNKNGFTLVELIVVVTILAILATIGFVSYSSYLVGVRDTNRLSQMVSIHDGLELYRTKKDLPLPDSNIEIKANGETIAYQGTAGSNALETIDFTKGGKDPKDDSYFGYYLTEDRKYFQLMSFLEEEENLQSIFMNGIFKETKATNYQNRIPAVYGKKLGIVTNENQVPIHEDSTLISLGEVDFDGANAAEKFSVYLESGRKYSFSGSILNHKMYSLSKPGTYGAMKGCPIGFVGVPGDSSFDQRGFCVAQFEMSFEGVTTRDAPSRNAVMYGSHPGTKIQSKKGGFPISRITQQQSIDACKSLGSRYHLITNKEWMTVARNIEFEKENWTGSDAGEGYISSGNSNSPVYGCQDQTPSGNNGATTGPTANTSCNELRRKRLSNSAYVWDMSGNLREYVNKANTLDGTGFDTGSNASVTSGGSGKVFWDDPVLTGDEKSDYGPLIINAASLADNKGAGYISPGTGTIFLRGGSGTSGTDSGLYDLLLGETGSSFHSAFGFRCAYQ